MWAEIRRLTQRRGVAKRWPWSSAGTLLQPLLSKQELVELQAAAQAWAAQARFDMQTAQPSLGEMNSPYRGAGYEFDENRLYSAGDDTRFINWRLYARSGQLHVKVFHEEHRPQIFVLMDRRASMRFGTRRQLKVTQAARLACLHLFRARARALPVGALLLQTAPEWYNNVHDESALQEMVTGVCAPSPPRRGDSDGPSLVAMLRHVKALLTAGAELVLISDFHDLRAEDAGVFWETAQQHTLRAYQITDPAETHLPQAPGLRLCDPLGRWHIDTAQLNKQLVRAYEQGFAEHLATCRHTLASAGVQLQHVSTEDDVVTLLARASDGPQHP